MYLARIAIDGGVALVARPTPGILIRLDGEFDTDDPVVALAERGHSGVAAAVAAAWNEGAPTAGLTLPEAAATFEPPVGQCSKIICVALNYRAHAAEGNVEAPERPVLFFKPPSSLLGHQRPVVRPPETRRLEHEVELGVVIGGRVRDVALDAWQSAVAGYTIVNDVTDRDMQMASIEANLPWDDSKAFDSFAPVGPYLVTPEDVPDPNRLRLRARVDGDLRQDSSTELMVHDIAKLIWWASHLMTLEPGDIIATGTPEGIGPVRDGERMSLEIDGLGVLVNEVQPSLGATSAQ